VYNPSIHALIHMKKISFPSVYTIILALIAIYALWLLIPQSCEPSGKSEQFNHKSDVSLIVDSLQKIETDKIKKESDLLLKVYKDSLATIKASREKLSVNYYALRAVVKKLQTVRIDSIGQVVNVPAIEYNASINSGTMCDSLLMYMDSELAIKDSIISVKDIEIDSLIKKVETGEIAQADLLALIEHLKKELKKCKDQNKALKIALLIDTLAHFLH